MRHRPELQRGGPHPVHHTPDVEEEDVRLLATGPFGDGRRDVIVRDVDGGVLVQTPDDRGPDADFKMQKRLRRSRQLRSTAEMRNLPDSLGFVPFVFHAGVKGLQICSSAAGNNVIHFDGVLMRALVG